MVEEKVRRVWGHDRELEAIARALKKAADDVVVGTKARVAIFILYHVESKTSNTQSFFASLVKSKIVIMCSCRVSKVGMHCELPQICQPKHRRQARPIGGQANESGSSTRFRN